MLSPQEFRKNLGRQDVWYALFYALIVLGAYFQIDYIVKFNPMDHIWSDPQRHWEQGSDTLGNSPMSMIDPIMYQLYIGVLAKLTFGNPVLVAFYTSLLALFTPWVWYRFFRELQPSKFLATGGWAALSMLPSWTTIYGYFMQETLLLPLLGAALYASWRCRRKQDVSSFIAMVLIWIAAGLTRGIVIPMAAVACSWLWLVQEEKVKKAAFSMVLLALIMGPLTYRTYQAMTIVAPHGIGDLVAIYSRSGNREIQISFSRGDEKWGYWFVSPSMVDQPLAPLSDWRTARAGVVRAHINIDKGQEDWDSALSANALSWDDYFRLTGENLIFLFFGNCWPDHNMGRLLDQINHHTRWLWAPATLAVLIWTLMCWRRLRGNRMLAIIILAWIVVQGLIPIAVNEGRYRKPFEGLLLAQLILLGSLRRGQHANTTPSDAPNPTLVAPLTLASLALYMLAARSYTLLQSRVSFDQEGRVYLSDMTALFHRQGWGTLGLDQNLEQTAISIYGTRFSKGIAVHADSLTRYNIPADAKYFHSFIGLDNAGRSGLVEFKIQLDGQEVFSSGPVRNARARELLLPVQGSSEMILIVNALGDKDHDHADWADSYFVHKDVRIPDKDDERDAKAGATPDPVSGSE